MDQAYAEYVKNDDINNGIIKKSTYGKKEHFTKMWWSIGEFHKVHWQPILKNYEYHRMLYFLLGKHEFKNVRKKALWKKIVLWWQNMIMLKHWRHSLTCKLSHMHLDSTILSPLKAAYVNTPIKITIM